MDTPNSNEVVSSSGSNDGVEIVTLNDTNNKTHPDDKSSERPPMPRAGTTVIHQADASHEHHEHHHHHHHHEQKKGKELSRVPYELERLRKKRPLLDALRPTKLKDLFKVSYMFRYVVCCIVGCICFISLAVLWQYIFEINTCHIEDNPKGEWVLMPFKYGFMTAYRFGLLVIAPLLFVLLPTVGVVSRHRIKFIATFLIITFILFTCYGFYGLQWSEYLYVSTGIIGFIAIAAFFYYGGYFATWVVFPFFSATFIAFIMMSLMREYVWSLINKDNEPFLFGIIYPMYLTLLQHVTLKVMLWFRLPYKIRKAFSKCCPKCCCRTHVYANSTATTTDVLTPVFYDNYTENELKEDHFWMTSISFSFKLKYVEGPSSEQQMADLQTAEAKKHEPVETMQEIKEEVENQQEQELEVKQTEKDEDIKDNKPETVNEEDEQEKKEEDDGQKVKHENTDTQIVNTSEMVRKTKTKHSGSHRYKSTELQLTVEDVWSNDILFVAGGTVIVLMESMRVAGMVALKDDVGALIISILSSIVLECLSRNNLYLEFFYRCCLRRENRALSRFYSSILGTQFQTEYIPYFVVAMMNLMKFGPTRECTKNSLDPSVSLNFRIYWWMYVLLFASEMLSDLFAECVKKLGRKKGVFGDEYGDPARKATFVKLKPVFMLCVFVAFFALSYTAFELDFDAKVSRDQ